MNARRSLFRRGAVALAAAGLALATVVAAVHPAELVLSQGQDTEAAQANVDAEWQTSFASVVSGSVKSVPKTDKSWFHDLRNQYVLSNSGSAQSRATLNSTERYERDNFQQSRTNVADLSSHLISNTVPTIPGTLASPNYYNAGGPVVSVNEAAPNWNGNAFLAPDPMVSPRSERCLVVKENFQTSSGNDSRCSLGDGRMSAASNRARFGIALDADQVTWTYVNAGNVNTSVKCGPNAAEATAPTGRIDIGSLRHAALGIGDRPYLSYGSSSQQATLWSTSGNGQETTPPTVNQFRTISGRVAGGSDSNGTFAKVLPIVTAYVDPDVPYALSEVALYLELYNNNKFSQSNLQTKLYVVASRSECGVRPLGQSEAFSQTAVFPNSMPAGNGFTQYSGTGWNRGGQYEIPTSSGLIGDFVAAIQAGSPAGRGTHGEQTATSTSSPIEDATGVEVTTSAPPEGGDGDKDEASATSGPASSTSAGAGAESTSDVMGDGGSETASSEPSTTTPSTAPTTSATTATSEVPTVPDEPGRLPADAEFCESLKIDGEYVDAFTADECDAAARISAMLALEEYIADGTQDSRWKGFTSDDPELEGWRWAAIDQRTGHVVYVP